MTWPYERLGLVDLDDIIGAHRQLEADLGVSVAPVGLAFARSLAERPDLAVLGSDAEHQTWHGAYLAAATIYATLFDRSPEDLPYRPDTISADDAVFIQRIAWETVQAWKGEPPAP